LCLPCFEHADVSAIERAGDDLYPARRTTIVCSRARIGCVRGKPNAGRGVSPSAQTANDSRTPGEAPPLAAIARVPFTVAAISA
jgi:hypothetical protein